MHREKGEPFSQQADKGNWVGVKGKLSERAWDTPEGEKRNKLEVQAFERRVKKVRRCDKSVWHVATLMPLGALFHFAASSSIHKLAVAPGAMRRDSIDRVGVNS